MNKHFQCWFVCAILCLAVTASAQVATGTPVMGSFSSGPDVINLGNLNVHFAIPVFSKPGRGTPFDYILSLDSSVWTPVSSSGTKSWQPDGNWGWRAITEAATGYVSYNRSTVPCLVDSGQEYIPPRPPRYINESITTNYQYHDAFGVSHTGFTNISGGCPGDTDPTDSVSTDSAGLTLDTSAGTITTPQGAVFHVPFGSPNGSATVTDRNGNQITTTTGSTFTDTLGMTALSVTGGAPSPLVLTYTTSSGTPASVTVNYSTYTVQTAFGCSGISEYGPTSIPLVSNVTLPDGSSYSFQYESTPGFPANITGRVKAITLRTGGTISYVYTGGTNGIVCSDGSTSGLSRTTSDGTTDYSRSGSGSAWTTTILDAYSPRNQTVISFQAAGSPANFYETHRSLYQGASTVVAQSDICYNSTIEPNCSTTAITLPISEIKSYRILNNGQQSLKDTVINTFGLLTEIDDYDFGSSPHGALLRKSLISYASLGNGLIGMPSVITIQDGSGHQQAQQLFGYDQTAVTATSGVPQHVAITGSRGNQTTLTKWVSSISANLAFTFTYDDTGNLLTSTDPAGNQTLFSYLDNFSDGVNRNSVAYLTQLTEPSTGSPAVSHIMGAKFDPNTGLKTSIWDFNNNSTTYTYDALLRPLLINSPDGGQVSYTYNSPTSTTQNTKLSASQIISVTTLLDGMGRASQQQLTSDPVGTTTADASYDANGFLSSISNPHRAASSPTDGTMRFTYDALGRVILITQADGNTKQAVYSNNCVTIADEASKQRMHCFDALGRMTSVFEPDSTGALNWETDTAYDALDDAISITQKGGSTISSQWRTRNFSYDGLARPTQTVAPESGTTNIYYTTSTGGLCAGDTGSQCRVTDARSITKTFSYDALSRLTGKTYSDSTASVIYSYDQSSFNGLTIANGNGARTSMTDTSGSTAWSFDSMGRVITRQQTIGSITKNIQYTYNLDGSVATMIYPSGRVYNYGYNGAQEITSIADTAHGINYFTNGQYAPVGLLTGGIHGAVTGWNAITLANTYNSRLQPTQFLATSPVPLTLLNLSYGYDQGGGKNNDDIVQITNGRDSTRTVAYTYDQVNRLSTAQTSTASTWGDSYVYDAWGNLLQKNVIKGTAETMAVTVDANNHVTAPAFTYDAAGNVTSDTSVSMVYDAEGRMNPTTGTSYIYDGDGRRVQKSDGTVYWIDDSSHPLSTGTTTGSMTRDFIFLGDKRIAFVSLTSGNPYYYLSDNLGSTAVIASGDGKTVQWEGDYFPFGSQRKVFTNIASNSYQFTGYEYDSDTLDNYANARYESGRWGLFLSPDTYLGSIDLGNPQTLNRYAYVVDNPTNLIDPLGLCTFSFDGVTVHARCDGSASAPSDPLLAPPDGFGGGQHQPLQDGGDGGHGGGGRRFFPTPAPSPAVCTAATAVAGAGIGTLVGGGIGEALGGVAGGAGGTLVAPGVGTLGGSILGAQGGATLGGLIGSAVGTAVGGLVGHILCAKGSGPSFGGNSQQNKQANDAKRDAERETGKKMTPDQEERFHDEVSGQVYGYWKMREIAVQILNKLI